MCVVLLMSKTLEWWSWSKLVKASDSLYPAGTYATFSVAARHFYCCCCCCCCEWLRLTSAAKKRGSEINIFISFITQQGSIQDAIQNTTRRLRYFKWIRTIICVRMWSPFSIRHSQVCFFNVMRLFYFIIWNMVMICTSVQWKICSSCSDCFV